MGDKEDKIKREADAARAAIKKAQGKKPGKNKGRRSGDKGPDWSGITKNPHNLTGEQQRIIDSWG